MLANRDGGIFTSATLAADGFFWNAITQNQVVDSARKLVPYLPLFLEGLACGPGDGPVFTLCLGSDWTSV